MKIRYLSQNHHGQNHMGMGHYERFLMRHLSSLAARAGMTFDLLYDGRRKRGGSNDCVGSCVKSRWLGSSSVRLAQLPWKFVRWVVRLREALRPADLYHSLALRFPPPAGRPFILTIHDLPPWRFDDEGTLPQWSRMAAQTAAGVVTPSEFGKREILELLQVQDQKVHVIPNGCDHQKFHADVLPTSPEELRRMDIHTPFLLYAGGATRRKNVPSMLEAWKTVAHRFPEVSLLLAGPQEQLLALVKQAEAPRARALGYVPHEKLRCIMKASEALIVPSIYEGFGLPPLEAMALGVPVMAVNRTAIPEVVGENAVLCRDGSENELVEGMLTILENNDLREELRRSGPIRAQQFTWERHAEQVLELYQMVLSKKKGSLN